MSRVWLVTRREVVTRGRSRSFLIGLALSALLVAGLSVVPGVFGGDPSYSVGVSGAGAQQLRPALQARAGSDGVDLTVTVLPDGDAARAAVAGGQVDAVVAGRTVLYDDELSSALVQLLEAAHRQVTAEQRLRAAGLDPQQVTQALAVPPLEPVNLGDGGGDAPAKRVLAVAVVLLMLMMIYLPAVYVAMGVVEEKSSRVVELLLATLRPWQLLAGKIIGIGLLGLGQLSVLAGVGLGAAAVTGVLPDLPDGTPAVAAGTFVWFLLGYAFFSAMAAASGALVSRQEEVNGVMTPVTLLMMAAYVVGFFAVFNPDAPLSHVLSITPPFSAIVMPVRTASSAVPAWEVATAIGLMAAATAVMVALGARVYERAVLRTGARVRLREVVAARGA